MDITNFPDLVSSLVPALSDALVTDFNLGYILVGFQAVILAIGFISGILIANNFNFWKW